MTSLFSRSVLFKTYSPVQRFNINQTFLLYNSTEIRVQNSTFQRYFCTNQRITNQNQPNNYSQSIFGLSSGGGKSGVAIIRLSGSHSNQIVKNLTQRDTLPPKRVATYSKIYDPETKEEIDKGILLWFPGPESYTGEDVCEFHVHGSIAVTNELLETLSKQENCQLAEPGEFTRRAFYNNKLDMSQIEGLADLINSETKYQKNQALHQLSGSLSKKCDIYREKIAKGLAYLEAFIDFGEEEEIDSTIIKTIRSNISSVLLELQNLLNIFSVSQKIRSGASIVIGGPPNAGKSSLFNLIGSHSKSIVSDISGTTRDVIEHQANIKGYPVNIFDTAGVIVDISGMKNLDKIERIGIERAKKKFQNADIKILLFDLTQKNLKKQNDEIFEFLFKKNIDDTETETENENEKNEKTIIVLNKTDLENNYNINNISDNLEFRKFLKNNSSNTVVVSCLTEKGIPDFLKILEKEVKTIFNYGSEVSNNLGNATITRLRHRNLINQTKNSLEQFLELLSLENNDVVLCAEELRFALNSLGKITGKSTNVDQLLDVIFRDFCIGK